MVTRQRVRLPKEVLGAFVSVALALAAAAIVWSQPSLLTPAPAQQPTPVSPDAPEISTHDVASNFVARVTLVSVPVVVRDSKGNSIGNLTKDNFALFDKGKPQQITDFTLEETRAEAAPAKTSTLLPGEIPPPEILDPRRFVACLFDDLNLDISGVTRLRKAAEALIETLPPTDRVAIYSTSGEINLDFTDNRELLRAALTRLRPSTMTRVGAMISPTLRGVNSFNLLGDIVRRLATAPGQRVIAWVSPGFSTSETSMGWMGFKMQLIDQAIHAKVIINAIDARGLYTDPNFDGANVRSNGRSGLSAAEEQSNVLAEVSYGTGGVFHESSNNFDEGFRRVAAAPEYIYVLGFSPQNLKSDSSFHQLKVGLKDVPGSLTLEARRGYYAPRRSDDAAGAAEEAIQSALFSREELSELPIAVQTQFFRSNDATAKVTVLVHLDIKLFKFGKSDGRNNNTVTVVAGLFDRNGKYLQGIQKLLELHLKDETLPKLSNAITLRATFDVQPGPYLIRTIVRDSHGQMMSATNSSVSIQ